MKIDKRILIAARRDGLVTEAQLKQQIYMTRLDYYSAVVEAYDQGVASNTVKVPRYIIIWLVTSTLFTITTLLYWLFAWLGQ